MTHSMAIMLSMGWGMTDDAIILLENCIILFKSSQNCFSCSKEFGLNDNIKICCDCFKIYHYKFTELKLI
jgi:hypothetical protein